jgi:hypothetical protein
MWFPSYRPKHAAHLQGSKPYLHGSTNSPKRRNLKILGSRRVTQKTNKHRRQRIEFGHPGCGHPQIYPEDGKSRFLEHAGQHVEEYKAF